MDAAQINLHFATNATQFGRFSVNSYDSKASTGTGYRNRFVVDENGIGWWDQNGTKIGDIVAGAWRFFGNSQGGSVDFVSNLGQSSQSVRMSMWQPNGGGVTVKAWAGGLESRNIGDTLFAPVVASAFTVGSDRRWKTDIADADLDSRAVLGAMRVRKYRVRVPNRDDDGYHEVEQIGLVAQEAPPMLVPEGRSDGTLGIDLYQQINVLTLALQRGFVLVDDLVRRVAALEARRP
jgi:hypothetical protein